MSWDGEVVGDSSEVGGLVEGEGGGITDQAVDCLVIPTESST